ncbi:MAG: hypothetical protein JST39_14215, partial [Bacteroidetes bacterium]|nr:hypothetical protein [Bacteroidota bacterium]
LLVGLTVSYAHAQTKVFKEVSEEISSQMKIIRQDNALVGYLVFTQLEKASADSFNYKISIMDENLNDIGSVKFRDIKMVLQSVSFEQDVLCLAYLKSSIIGTVFDNRKDYKAALKGDNNTYVVTQFLGLDGRIIKTNSIEVDVTASENYVTRKKVVGTGSLKEDIQLRNIPQKGFALFYGDDSKKSLNIYDPAGKLTWSTIVSENAQGFALLSSGPDIYLLMKKENTMYEGGFELLGYNVNEKTSYAKVKLKDKKGNQLKVLTFDNDPVTGKPYISGNIISERYGNYAATSRDISHGTYSGVFTINVNGHDKSDFAESYTYWDDGSQSFMNKRGYYTEQHAYARMERSFKDFQGNTWFAGSSFVKKPKWVSIAAGVITAPTLIGPMAIFGIGGSSKTKFRDAFLLKQAPKGALTFETTVAANDSKYFRTRFPMSWYDKRSYYIVTNTDTKT